MSDYPGRLMDILDTDSDDCLLPVQGKISLERYTKVIQLLDALQRTGGVNPQGDKGSERNRFDQLDAQVVDFGSTGLRNLRITNDGTTPDSKLVVTADFVEVEGYTAQGVSRTLNIASTGFDGITFTRTASTWGYVWLGVNPSNGLTTVIFDDSYDRGTIDTTHGSLSGYTAWRRMGSRYLNATGSGNFLRGTQYDTRMVYDQTEDGAILDGATSKATLSRNTSVPPTAGLMHVYFYLNKDSNDYPGTTRLNSLIVYPKNSALGGVAILQRRDRGYLEAVVGNHWVPLTTTPTNRELEFATSFAVTHSGFDGIVASTLGYLDQI